MDKQLLHKPNQLIMMNSKDLTVSQRKIYNVVLFDAKKALNKDPSLTEFTYSFSDLKKRAGVKATDNVHLKADFEALRIMHISSVVEDKDSWNFSGLIGGTRRDKDLLIVELPKLIRDALITSEYYTTLDLIAARPLTRKYSLIMYEVGVRYRDIGIPYLTLEEVKQLLGIENTKTYRHMFAIKQKILDPMVKEINTKTQCRISYTLIKEGTTTVGIQFKMRHVKKRKDNLTYAPKPISVKHGVNIYNDHKDSVDGSEYLEKLKKALKK